MGILLQAFRQSLRHWSRDGGHTALAILILGFGIGLTTAAFSVAYGVFLRGLPLPHSERLMSVEAVNLKSNERMPVSLIDYLDLRREMKSFVGLAAWYGSSLTVSGRGEPPEQYNGAFVTANFFALAGVRPSAGRGFHIGEDSPTALPVAVISDHLWRQRFGGDPTAVGRRIRIEGEETTIVGVMPKGFGFPLRQAIWVPLREDSASMQRGAAMPVQVFGRLKVGVLRSAAQADLATLSLRLAHEYPATNRDLGAVVTPYVQAYTAELRPTLYMMLAATLGVYFIACLNVATLLLLQSAKRSHEYAVQRALGASRTTLSLGCISDAALLAVLGATLGLAFAQAFIRLYLAYMEGELPSFWMVVRIDRGVLSFASGLAVAACLLTGLLPALLASRRPIREGLRDLTVGIKSDRKLGNLMQALVLAEIILSSGLLVATGLLVKSVRTLQDVELGFSTADIVTARLSLPYGRYPDPASRLQFLQALEGRLTSVPDAAEVAFSSRLPGDYPPNVPFEVEGTQRRDAGELPQVPTLTVSRSYFQTLGVQPLAGRLFDISDREDAPFAAVVTSSFVRHNFPRAAALGARIRTAGRKAGPWLTIVGVIPDLSVNGLTDPQRDTVFLSLDQNPLGWLAILLKVRRPEAAPVPAIVAAVSSLDPDLPIFSPDTLAQRIETQRLPHRMMETLFTVLGAGALFLATLGLYGVMSYKVARDRASIGVRMALGAQVRDVVGQVLLSGGRLLVSGVILGCALALWLSKLLSSLLFAVKPSDPGVYLGVSLVVLIVGLAACALPAKRAAAVDPLTAIKVSVP